MKTGTIISLVVSAVIGLLAVAATVPFDEATSNVASWSEPLFWLGLVLIAVPTIIASRAVYKRLMKRLAQTVPATPPADHWAERKRLEISVIANLSAHREPNASPIAGEPENSRLRELKDAIEAGQFDAEINGPKPNVMSTVTFADFEMYVAATNKPYWVEVLHCWQLVQNPPAGKLAEALKAKRIPLLTFLDLVREADWQVLDPQGYGGFDLIHGLSEAAGLGDISLLGKPIDRQMPSFIKSEKLQRIPPVAWTNQEIDTLSCFKFKNPGYVIGLRDDNAETATKVDPGNRLAYQGYADLHIETEGLLDWLENDAEAYRGHYARTYGD